MKQFIVILILLLVSFYLYGQNNDTINLHYWKISNKSIKYQNQYNEEIIKIDLIGDSCFIINNKEKIFLSPEKNAMFSLDNKALQTYIKKNLEYQHYNKATNTVFVGFIIDSLGTVKYIGIRRGIDVYYDTAVYKLILKMPAWIPAQIKGKNVASFFLLPISSLVD